MRHNCLTFSGAYLGFYETYSGAYAMYPHPNRGDFMICGETNSLWIFDGSRWLDSMRTNIEQHLLPITIPVPDKDVNGNYLPVNVTITFEPNEIAGNQMTYFGLFPYAGTYRLSGFNKPNSTGLVVTISQASHVILFFDGDLWNHTAVEITPNLVKLIDRINDLDIALREKIRIAEQIGAAAQQLAVKAQDTANQGKSYAEGALEQISTTNTRIDKLVGGNATSAIDNFNEIEKFLQGITDTNTLTALLVEVEKKITANTTKITANDTAIIRNRQDIVDVNARLETSNIEIDKKLNTADFNAKVGASGGICPLDSNAKVPASHLPGYVDDVINLFSMGAALDGQNPIKPIPGKAYNPATKKIDTYDGVDAQGAEVVSSANPETDKIYVNLATNKTYRWSDIEMVILSESLALGETTSTAYAGNKGKANATAIAGLTTRIGTTERRLDTAEACIIEEKQNLTQLSNIVSNNTKGIKDSNVFITENQLNISKQETEILKLKDKLLDRIPTAIELDYQQNITFRNNVLKRIAYTLTPLKAYNNVLFLGDDNAISVFPDGEFKTNKPGVSKIHVIPTENTTLYQTVTITVVEPTLRKLSANSLCIMGTKKALKLN